MAEGIRVRHSRACASRNGRDCNCDPSYEASVWLKREHVQRGWRNNCMTSVEALDNLLTWDGHAQGASQPQDLVERLNLNRRGQPLDPGAAEFVMWAMRPRCVPERLSPRSRALESASSDRRDLPVAMAIRPSILCASQTEDRNEHGGVDASHTPQALAGKAK